MISNTSIYKLPCVTIVFLLLCCLQTKATDFVINNGSEVYIYIPSTQRQVAETALDMMCGDMRQVLSAKIKPCKRQKQAKIVLSYDPSLPCEGYTLAVSNGKLLITGADEHGLAYGMMELSRLMGVSPWIYWADCLPSSLSVFTLREGYKSEQHPDVRYRGIFINDEDWGLNPWATKQEPEAWTIRQKGIKGAIGPKVNEKIFQLLLRLKANYYWPAMHECSQPFFTIKGNREIASKYGIYIGGSHCEPMATSPAAEWALRGTGDYNYVTNRDNVLKFWQERLDEVKDQEILYTLGMRGVHDGAMQGVKSKEDKVKYLQMVIDDQRKMLPEGVPQVFIPYKEVLDIYHNGLIVPDDVTLMWTDDNYGYIRHFPDSVERSRKGGNGLYYHCSYWGRPHDYLWLNSMPLHIMNNQLECAYNNGIRHIWVLNVGDIKPSELQTELFMDMAWNISLPCKESGTKSCLARYESFLETFCQREFGTLHGKEIKDILVSYFQLTSDCKPEFMAGTRVEEADKAYWNKIRHIPGDWDKTRVSRRVAEYQRISDKVDSLYHLITDNRKDAYFQLVKYPVQAAAQMSFKYLCPERCEQAHDSIQSLTRYYNNTCAGGKWNGIMDASPRRLAVFQKVTADMLPEYPDTSQWQAIPCIGNSEQEDIEKYDLHLAENTESTDSITLQVRLLPTHPINSKHLTFSIRVDGKEWHTRNYETYDRSEEWKQNVLRGYAQRTLTLAIDKSKKHHTIEFKPVSQGVYGCRIYHLLKPTKNKQP